MTTMATEVTEHRIAVSFGFMFDNCPSSLANLLAGTIQQGVFYPVGSVARHFYEMKQAKDRKERNNRPAPHVYLVRSGCDGPVKIGKAANVQQRMESLQTAHPYPLRLIAVIHHGGVAVERTLHKRFAAHRLAGEWFEWCEQIEEYVDNVAGNRSEAAG